MLKVLICLPLNIDYPSFRKGGEKLAYLKKRGEVSLHGKEVSLHGKEGEKSACMVKERREFIIS